MHRRSRSMMGRVPCFVSACCMVVIAAENRALGDPGIDVVAYIEQIDASIGAVHVTWDEIVVTYQPVLTECRSHKQLWITKDGLRYSIDGEQYDRELGKKAVRLEVIDDGSATTTFIPEFNGKQRSGAVLAPSGTGMSNIKFMAPVLLFAPLRTSFGGIDTKNIVNKSDLVAMPVGVVLSEARPNGTTRVLHYSPEGQRWIIQRAEIFHDQRLINQIDWTYAERQGGVPEAACPSKWVLTKFGSGSAVQESTTAINVACEINPELSSELLSLTLPEGTAVSDDRGEKHVFAYVGPEGRKIELSQKETRLSYDQVKNLRQRRWGVYVGVAMVLTLTFVTSAYVWWKRRK